MAAEGADWSAVLDPDSAMDELQAWKGRVDRMATDTHAMNVQLERLRTSARDGNDLVEVTIDSSGVLHGVEFTARIQRTAPETVSAAVMEALSRARATAAAQAGRIVEQTVGTASPAGRMIADQVAQRLAPYDPDPVEGRGR
ncbi:YbaB/EbfC family nucleoid-associated protein [Winogradskya humida]|uniref:YbaB/EbfC DNA-binding family protein n=1 Tax=Winogradskya humida TaxID=113566 RepID=A0ABQ4A7L8_9ACTN|nr:YbaB/EbfC family nucleoid-associated protein [Actinoplanes humidus]GIE26854.1 hypothetical protein Ahu01nite_099560 [Actinoplanes humidus]